jgi:hypothetical protein
VSIGRETPKFAFLLCFIISKCSAPQPMSGSAYVHRFAALRVLTTGRRQIKYVVPAAHSRRPAGANYLYTYIFISVSLYLSNNNDNNNWLQHPGNGVLGDVLWVRRIWEPYGSQALYRPYPPNPSPPIIVCTRFCRQVL